MKLVKKISFAFLSLFLLCALAACSDLADEDDSSPSSSGNSSGSSNGTSGTSNGTGVGSANSSSTYAPSCSDSDAHSITYSFTNASGVTVTYHAKYLIDGTTADYSASDFTDGAVTVSYSNEIAFLVINGGSLTLDGVTITKTGDATVTTSVTDDAYNFYGLNNVIVAVGEGSAAVINSCTINSTALHGNAVFATDDASITVTGGITITNKSRGSRGFFASYGGSVKSTDGNVSISTESNNSAALATDRGGGTITVTGSGNTLSTQANDSPCVYSTGTITVEGVTGTAAAAQAIVVEGKNAVSASDCTFTGARSGQGAIMLYQSMSGDASDSDASSMYTTAVLTKCTFYNRLASSSEAMFYITNTTAKVTESGCTFYAGTDSSAAAYTSSKVLILCGANSWGTSGSNGGTVTFTAGAETLTGMLSASASDSSITVTCADSSNLTKGSGSGTVTVNGSSL